MKILFQGDSVTDAGSYKKQYPELTGYTKLVAESLGEGNEYFNRGVSGNRVCNILDRYDEDIKAIAPDVMTILIGINDVWRRFDAGIYESAETYEIWLRELFEKYKKDFPSAKLIIMEPYIVYHEPKEYFRPVLAEFIAKLRALAVEFADGYIPLDGLFAKESLFVPAEELSPDGIHPAIKGQEMIARYLVEELKRVCKI